MTTKCRYYSVLATPANPEILFLRYICISVLHLLMIDKTVNSLMMMKFVVNTPYIFSEQAWPYMSAVLLNISSILIEFSNILVVLMTRDTLSVVGNFVALVIVSEFDEYVFASMKDENFRMLLDHEFTGRVCKVRHTTSKKC